MAQTHVVTGAFGYSGKYIAKRLLEVGHRVVTLTNSPNRPNPFGDRVEAKPFDFDNPDALRATLDGAEVLYNTYWVRFNHADFNHDEAVQNTLTLFAAAKAAGVRKVVHVSITNPSLESSLPYFRGKAVLEKALQESGLEFAILRPTVLFGKEDILVNNIAWALRRFPVFGMFGDGSYKIQPIYVDDIAALAVAQGSSTENKIIDAIGPETFTYRELVLAVGQAIGVERSVMALPPGLAYAFCTLVGSFVGDLIITKEEIEGLRQNLLVTHSSPAGQTKLTEWAKANADILGKRYNSELRRRKDRTAEYLRA